MSFLLGGKKGSKVEPGVIAPGMCSLSVMWDKEDQAGRISCQGSISQIAECNVALHDALRIIEAGKAKKVANEKMTLVIMWERLVGKTMVSGSAVDDYRECYKALSVVKDILRKHNELNCGYLEFKPVEIPKEKLN